MRGIISIFFICIWCVAGCQVSKESAITDKNQCYQGKLNELKKSALYNEVFSQFEDTSRVLFSQEKVFGVPGYAENKIDESIFFNKDSSDCLLLILQKPTDPKYVFGHARVINGTRSPVKWIFKIGLEFTYEKDYFDIYKDNNFENISKIARYNIMISGKPLKNNCGIDEDFWFVQMKD
jgi:hypothetical protein